MQSALGITKVTDNGVRAAYARDAKGTPITMEADANTGTRYNLISDYQGSVVALLDTTGNLAATYTYDPYGATTATGPAADANYLRWLGVYELRGGAYLTGYRYYNPTWARFTQPDPTHQEPNPYAYAQGDPVNGADPSGAYSWKDFGSLVGGLVGSAVGVAVGAACTATIVACAAAGFVVGGMVAGAGSALGTQIGGGSREDVYSNGLNALFGELI
ncbi:RHS repeat-associated core domain-containing protein [Amycolatopsis thermoflava]